MIQHKVCRFLDDPSCMAVSMFSMDFSKAFDTVNQHLFANKLKVIPLNPYIVNWWLIFLHDRMQRVVYNNVTCNWKHGNGGTTQGSLKSGPDLFSIFLNDLKISMGGETVCFKYADDCTIVVPVFKNNYNPPIRRQCGPVVRALALRSGDPVFKTRSDHSLNLILVVSGSTSQLHL